jgi:transcription initiation factor TFIIA large subunit
LCFDLLLAEYRAPTPEATPKPRNDEEDDDEPPLNEDDDDDDELDDLEQGEDEPNTQHLVLAQFDKVIALYDTMLCLGTSCFSPV